MNTYIRKRISLALLCLSILLCAASPFLQASNCNTRLMLNVTAANLRDAPPDLDSGALGRDIGDLVAGKTYLSDRIERNWYHICNPDGWVSGTLIDKAHIVTLTPAVTPTRIVPPLPTPVELIVFVKVFVKYGDNQSVDSGIFPWRANQPVSCQFVRVDNFPAPTPTPLLER